MSGFASWINRSAGIALLLWPIALAAAMESDVGPVDLRDITDATGITFVHTDGSSGRRYIVETVASGLATFDYDGDGLIDIYFLNGAPLRGSPVDPDDPPTNRLYRNNGNGTFSDVTQAAGVGDTGFGLGVAVADYNNNGLPDIYVNNFGPNVLYRNNGDGTFTDVTSEAGVAAGDMVGAGAAFLDIDQNGNLDLYCGNYVQFTYDNHVDVVVGGFPQYAGPKDYEPERDILFRNNGDGTFTDVSRASGVAAVAGTSMGMVCLDYDNDGHTDIVIMNDVLGNFLFHNDGSGRFQEIGLLAGMAYNVDGIPLGSMGVDCADYDNDGWLDLFQTAYAGELPALYRNTGQGFFDDVTRTAGAGIGDYPHVNWGTGFADLNNNGHRDLFIANGHLQDNIHLYSDSTTYEVRNTLLINTGDGRFVDRSRTSGDGLLVQRSSRGVALDDLNNNGLIDVVVLNSRSGPTILRNDTENDHHWLQIRLRGVQSNRDGVGAQVRVTAGGRTQMAEVHSGRGYQSHFGTRLHFGLGTADRVERVEVRWIGGRLDVLENLPVDRRIVITQSSG
ncbi:MAG: CRTAC1 family protein [Planctomycetaceae bacterium]|nr:MAG: CRTAC1 family protein [Planctomycetaceae bacterium]